MIVLGLTGSVGMGKSTTGRLFSAEGIPVFDADAAVHRLYRGDAVAPVEAAFPGVARDGVVDRDALGQKVRGHPEAMRRLESIVHPLVRREREDFVADARAAGAPIAVLDIPLLFETGADAEVDVVVVVSAAEPVQKARVMARPGMTLARFDAILASQTPDEEKRRRAHFIVETDKGIDHASRQVRDILAAVRNV